MRLRLRIQYADGSEKFTDAVFADFIGFERTWQRSVTAFEKEVKLTDLAWLAWSAEHRAGKTALRFDPDWIASVEMVTIADEQSDDAQADTANPS